MLYYKYTYYDNDHEIKYEQKINLILFSVLLISSFAYVNLTYGSVHTWDFTNSSDYSFDVSKLNVSSGEAKMKSVSTPTWYNDSWAYRKKITIDKTKVPSTLTNFPVLVQRTDLDWKDTSHGGSVARADGYDFVFTDADGITMLNYEVEKYTASTGELVAWVNLPSVSSSVDTEFYVYYGNSAATNQQNVNAVWDSNYKMVQHAKGSGQMNDSTSNSNSGTISGDPFESYSITSVSPHTGSHQGIATDGTYYYTIDTDSITKYDSSWVQSAQLLNANQSIGVNTTNHLSDGDYYNGKLYVPVENYVHPCVSSTNNYIVTWNASDLSFDNKIDVSGMGFSSAGLVIDPNAGDNGIIYNISYCDGTKIWKLDLSTGAYLGAINLSQPILNSQGITMKDGYFYISDDLNDIVWKVASDGTVLNSILSYPHVASGSLEGLDYNTNNLLVLIDQGVSDRKVYTFSKLPLTKIGSALDFKKSEALSIPYTLPDNGTLSLWYNPKNYFYNYQSLLDNSVGGNDWEMWVDSTGYVNFRVKDGETAVKYDLGDNTTQVGLNTWFYITIKWQKGGNKTLLVNGVQRGTNAATWINPGSSLYIGGGNPLNTKDNGYFDEIRISDTVRSNNWILAQYNNQNSPSTFFSVGTQTAPSFDVSDPSIVATNPVTITSSLTSFTETATKNGGEIKYQLTNNNGTTWYWWNGSTWASTVTGYTEANTASDINSHISTFPVGAGDFNFKGYFHSNGSQMIQLDSLEFTDDSTAPIISSVSSSTTNTSNTVTWSTDEQSSSQVEYGVTNSYGSTTTEADTSPRVISHSVVVSSLLPCTVYHYRVISKDSGSNTATGSDSAFSTTGCSGSANITQNSTTPITFGIGGSASLSAGTANLGLTIPANATGSNVFYQIKQLTGSTVIAGIGSPSGVSPSLNHIYDIKALSGVSAEVSSFGQPISITLVYQDSEISGLDESTLKIYRWDGSTWVQLDNCSVNTSSNTITCTTTHFSTFGLFGQENIVETNIPAGVVPLGFLNKAYIKNPQNLDPKPCPSYNFTRNLKYGIRGKDVKALQQTLNCLGFTLAQTGAGSSGHETTYFGKVTKQALINYQTAHNITPNVGYFGPITRESLENNSK